MLKINKFFLSDVRCFKGEEEFNIRPLTFLIGENSTGKSTVLGCLQAMNQYILGDKFMIDFNEAPYQMGRFEDICRRSKPKNTSFKLGFGGKSNKGKGANFKFELILNKQPDRATPAVKEARLIFDDAEIRFVNKKSTSSRIKSQVDLKQARNKKVFIITILSSEESPLAKIDHIRSWLDGFRSHIEDSIPGVQVAEKYRGYKPHRRHVKEKDETLNSPKKQLYEFMKSKNYSRLFDDLVSGHLDSRYFSFGHIYSEPQRTYDPLIDTETPSSSRIPVLLRNLSSTKSDDWERLREKLIGFGEQSGLFTDIQVKNLSDSSSTSFQLKFKIRKAQATNLTDVGHGISQILTILVYVLMTKNHTFLMQQPEIYLHPKAQAALTSLFIELTKQRNNNFIIETHSDYMIGRARIEIMKGNIKPEDVSLIYLEAKGKDVEVYNLGFDKLANFSPNNPPSNYRSFFLKEGYALLGWDD